MIRRGQLLPPLLGWTGQWRREQRTAQLQFSLEARTRCGEGRWALRSVLEPEISDRSRGRKTTSDRREGACAASHSRDPSGRQKGRGAPTVWQAAGAIQTLTAPIAYQQGALCPEWQTIRTRPAVPLRPCARGDPRPSCGNSVIKKLGRRLQKRIGLREREIA
jgi:hypothetical protein